MLEKLQADLRRQKRDSYQARLHLIEEWAPDILEDAKRFLALENVPPWETVILLPEGELGLLMDKYDLDFMRRRPSPKDVSTAADLFCEAIELLYDLWLMAQDDAQ